MKEGPLPTLTCSACGRGLPVPASGRGALSCPVCGAELEVELFPAFFRRPAAAVNAEAVADGTEASCFFHPHKKAALPCDHCGRFLCPLYEVDLGGRRLCPTCIEAGRTSGRMEELVTRRILHDQTALSLAIYPMLFFFVTLITAPIAIWMAIRHWNSPGSLVPRTRIRSVAAIGIATLQLCGWGLFFVALAN